MDVVPIIISEPSLGIFASLAREDLGRSITKGGDNARLDPKSYPAFLAALDSFTNESSVAVRACSENELILRHLHFAFYVKGQASNALTRCLTSHLSVDVASDGKSLIVSGDLYHWKHAIIHYCRVEYLKEARLIFNTIFNYFCQAKLREVWRDYERSELPDGSFQLTYRS